MPQPDRIVSFASDNTAGAQPEVLEAVVAANTGQVVSYGDDPHTARLREVIRDLFGPRAEIYPVFTGTAANVVALGAMTDRWDAAIVSAQAHTTVDECGAPEKVVGVKLLECATGDGRLRPADIESHLDGVKGVAHHAQPRVVSVAQSTEVGTTYSREALGTLAEAAHSRGLTLHVDGARVANAAAHLGCSLRELTDVGIDVLSLGGTKNGALGAEAVVVLNPGAVRGIGYIRKLSTQLPSKMRFVSAQLLALYDGDVWLRGAAHANAMARRLADGVADLVEITQPVEANAVFAVLPAAAASTLRRRYTFYDWDAPRGEVRWMCAWDTPPDAVDGFIAAIRAAAE